jgi:hypothetical protein
MKNVNRTPARRIFDPAFRYRRSHETDIRETFERVRREQAGAPRQSNETLRQEDEK